MVVSINYQDILNSDCRHIAFGINCEGINDGGFAGIIAKKYWPELAQMGKLDLGTVRSFKTDNRIYHACVVHSLDKAGWSQSPLYLKMCLDRIINELDEKIGIVMMGAGIVGQIQDADVTALIDTMHDYPLKLQVFSLHNLPCRVFIKTMLIPELFY